ncbi:DNA-directed RNA polymerase I subunit RPA34 [Sceloporus undulatus]|uniref:DNA-directed RNA polymerase I subunit RPA34 n=1 Tax=Sceloporus undulatus TaxID=8520 RepID=UPI001C4B7F42|nr:DNA-directed RNA polymerase I subunit RPA34 [Sceloporus undulatus]
MAAAMGRPRGPPRFQCPPDFCASRFAPGPPFSLRTLQDPSKCLLLIRAPADFSPESFEGHIMPLSGSQTLKVPQTDGTQKVYSVQATPEASDTCARLLVPSGHQDQLTCAPPFSGSLSIWERFGDASANPALFPVADRQTPQIPEGLKQRFVPFGGQLKRPALGEAAEEPPQKKRKKKKKRKLKMVGYMGDPEEETDLVDRVPETPPEESMTAVDHWEGEESYHQLKNRMEENGEALCEQESQPSSSLLFSSQESLFLEQGPSEKKKKKKKKLKEEVLESEELLGGLGSLTQTSEPEPGLQSEFDTPEREISSTGVEELVRHKHKKNKKKREEEATIEEAPLSIDLFPIKEEAMSGENGMGSPTVGTSGLVAEELGLLGYKSRKKKKKKEKMEEEAPSEQAGGTMLLEPISVKKELKGCDVLASSFGEGLAQGELLEPSMETPSQKHKKKKKKEHKKEAA